MTIGDLEHFRDLLLEREENLRMLIESSSLDDDQAIKTQSVLTEITEALERVKDNTYGTCTVCKGEVEKERLEIQPAAEICLDCISRQERTRLEEDLHLASKVHRALLPQAVARIDGFEVAVKSLAARIIGGDYYDFLPGPHDDSTRIVIADTMGKGLPAGLLMSNVQGALRILADDIQSSEKLISRLNEWLCRNVPVTKFISLFCLTVKPDSDDQFTYVNAGHPPPIVYRADGTIERLQPTGAVLGVAEDFVFHENRSNFGAGDLMLLYTDGVTDAVDGRNEMFGEERLLDFVRRRPAGSAADLVVGLQEEIRSFTGRHDFDDDLTIVAMRRNAA